MPRTESQKLARNRFEAKTYDQVLTKVKKGVKGKWKQAAELRGLGLMELVRNGVEEYIQNHPVKESD